MAIVSMHWKPKYKYCLLWEYFSNYQFLFISTYKCIHAPSQQLIYKWLSNWFNHSVLLDLQRGESNPQSHFSCLHNNVPDQSTSHRNTHKRSTRGWCNHKEAHQDVENVHFPVRVNRVGIRTVLLIRSSN